MYRNNDDAYLNGIVAKAVGRELAREGNTASGEDVTRKLLDAFAASSGNCVSCEQTLVKEGGHPLTWSADRVRSELLLYEGIVEQEPRKVCTNLAGLLVNVPCKGCT